MINKHSKPWTIRIKGHPYVTDGDWRFDGLLELERFVGKNDIQLDMIVEIDRWKGSNTIITYKAVDILSISAIRLVLAEECPEVPKVLFDNHGQLLGT